MGYDRTERTVRPFLAGLHCRREPERVVRFETALGQLALGYLSESPVQFKNQHARHPVCRRLCESAVIRRTALVN